MQSDERCCTHNRVERGPDMFRCVGCGARMTAMVQNGDAKAWFTPTPKAPEVERCAPRLDGGTHEYVSGVCVSRGANPPEKPDSSPAEPREMTFEAAMEHLRDFGRHNEGCSAPYGWPCKCGWDDVEKWLAAYEAGRRTR